MKRHEAMACCLRHCPGNRINAFSVPLAEGFASQVQPFLPRVVRPELQVLPIACCKDNMLCQEPQCDSREAISCCLRHCPGASIMHSAFILLMDLQRRSKARLDLLG